jgi:hypothetical protein
VVVERPSVVLEFAQDVHFQADVEITPVRAILDAHADGLGPALIGQAIDDGQRLGVLTRAQAAQLQDVTVGAR